MEKEQVFELLAHGYDLLAVRSDAAVYDKAVEEVFDLLMTEPRYLSGGKGYRIATMTRAEEMILEWAGLSKDSFFSSESHHTEYGKGV